MSKIQDLDKLQLDAYRRMTDKSIEKWAPATEADLNQLSSLVAEFPNSGSRRISLS